MSGPETSDGPGWVRVFAPGSVSNLCCGFDLLGFAIRHWGDVVAARPAEPPGVRLVEVSGDGGRLPRDPAANTAGVAASRLLATTGVADRLGVELKLAKGLPLASGLGSSGASGVAAAVAVDAALGLGAAREHLLAAALEAERVACGSAHPDNVTPSLIGGLVLVRPGSPPRISRLPVPDGLTAAVLHPHAEVTTAAAREALPERVPLVTLTRQAGNLAAFVTGLFQDDDKLIASALVDHVAEPVRAPLVPGFEAMRGAALAAGALGCGLSGSGPSVFALCRGADRAQAAGESMVAALGEAAGIGGDLLVTPVASYGARVLPATDEKRPS